MWLGRSDADAQAWLGRDRVAWRRGTEPIELARVTDVSAGLAKLSEWGARPRPPRRLVVWLDGSLCRLHRMPAVTGASGLAEADLAAQAQLSNTLGPGSGSIVRLSCWPSPSTHWLVVSVPDGILEGLTERFGKALRSVRPWWSWAMPSGDSSMPANVSRTKVGTVVAYDGQAMTFCVADARGEVSDAGTIYPIADLQAARRWLLRREMADDGRSPEVVFLNWGEKSNDGEDTGIRRADSVSRQFGFSNWVQRGF